MINCNGSILRGATAAGAEPIDKDGNVVPGAFNSTEHEISVVR